jgi:hypothetical protein
MGDRRGPPRSAKKIGHPAHSVELPYLISASPQRGHRLDPSQGSTTALAALRSDRHGLEIDPAYIASLASRQIKIANLCKGK